MRASERASCTLCQAKIAHSQRNTPHSRMLCCLRLLLLLLQWPLDLVSLCVFVGVFHEQAAVEFLVLPKILPNSKALKPIPMHHRVPAVTIGVVSDGGGNGGNGGKGGGAGAAATESLQISCLQIVLQIVQMFALVRSTVGLRQCKEGALDW